MIVVLAVAAFLIAHGLVHALFLAPPPAAKDGPTWPFELDRSWLLGPLGVAPGTSRILGLVLVVLTIATCCLAGIVTLGIVTELWAASVALAASVSLVLLGLFYQPWLTIGVGIDLALLWAVLVMGWTPGDTLL
jgi:hypothetical protein